MVSALTLTQEAEATFVVSGALTHDSYQAFWQKWQSLSSSTQRNLAINLRFESIDAWDSSAVALIVALQRHARARQQTLKINGLPTPIKQLARLYNLSPQQLALAD